MSNPPEADFEVVVRPGFAVVLACLVLIFTGLYLFAGQLAGEGTTFPMALNWAAGVVVLVLLGIMLHELGHVAVAASRGQRWTRVVLDRSGLGVVIQPGAPGWPSVLRSLAGPVVQLIVALPMLATVYLEDPNIPLTLRNGDHSFWWVAGVSNVLIALANLVPVRGWDGGQALAGIREALRKDA
ncbi:MAG TPA: M50 family metallopeptidase [Propionicimonas sp.]|uniref:M50 family metallopeptidase n=1 Tax=Propionicimonas sp. TaxID=1955623 RepID=UPI002F3EE23A